MEFGELEDLGDIEGTEKDTIGGRDLSRSCRFY